MLTAFVAVTSIAVVLQMCILLALYLSVKKTTARMESIAADLQRRAVPVLDTASEIIADAKPKIQVITTNAAEMSTIAKERGDQISVAVAEIVERTRSQIERADEVVTRTMEHVHTVESKVLNPVRKVTGVIQAVQATMSAFMGQKKEGPRARGQRGPNDEGMFI